MMDIRHPFTPFDRMMLDWAKKTGMPVHVLLTKCDKLTPGAGRTALQKARKQLQDEWGEIAGIQLFSATKRLGTDEAYAQLAAWLQLIEPDLPADIL